MATSVSRRNWATPTGLLPFAFIAMVVIAGPIVGLLVTIPWSRLPQLVTTDEAVTSFRLSVLTASASTVVCIALGTPLALWLRQWARQRPQLVGVLELMVYAPLVLSPVVSGLALVFFWGRRGLVGEWLDNMGIPIAYSTWGVVVVQVFVSLPFFVATLATALRAIPILLEEAAATEGATRGQIMRHIVLPLAAPGMVTGAVLSFARSLSEYGATLTFAGNVAGQSRTIPLLVSLGLSSGDMDQALGACILLLGIYLLVMGGIVAAMILPRVRRRA